MKHILYILSILILLVTGCGIQHHLPSENTNVHWVIRDSVRYIDSMVPVPIPVERIVDVVPVYDTLKLETTVARAQAYVDTTTHTLKGRIENRKDSIKTVIKYKERKVIEYRDSIKIREVPVEVEVVRKVVPSWCWWMVGFNVLVLALLAVKIYLKLRIGF